VSGGPAVAAALLLDALLGEPPEPVHPTVMMGRVISTCEERILRLDDPRAQRAAGLLLAASLPLLTYTLAGAALKASPRPCRTAFEVALLSTAISMRGLARAAEETERALLLGDLPAARERVGRFVGRETENLSEEEVARAAVESVAENTSDGVVAPMLYGAFLGAPGALAYKAINTLDSMVGYREPPYTDLGCASARLDDLANLLPARLTTVAVALSSQHPGHALKTALRYGPLTGSPNAGWVEAAFAGALELRLGGVNIYRGESRHGPILGDGDRPVVRDIGRAAGLMRRSCVLLAVCFALTRLLRRD
jgi:adenosylcobinamide-phosphate synthase